MSVVPAEFFDREYSEYSFRSLGQASQQQVETFELTLDERGLADAELTSSFELEKTDSFALLWMDLYWMSEGAQIEPALKSHGYRARLRGCLPCLESK